jgi:Uma2 family endonuclease
MTAQEYLAWEAQQVERHELVNGELLASPCTEDTHVTITGNLGAALHAHTSGTPCRTFISQMKLQVLETSSFFYPDILVTCSAADRLSRLVKREPVLLAEVLSPSTAAYDRGEKFAHYRRIPSLHELALIDPESRCTDVYRKGADGLWVLHPFEPGQSVNLASLEFTITAEALFAYVEDSPESLQGTTWAFVRITRTA